MKKMHFRFLHWSFILLSLALLGGCANPDVTVGAGEGGTLDGTDGDVEQTQPVENLVATIARYPQFSFFSNALEYTQLDALLSDEQYHYTVTVPNNTAFDALTENQRQTLLNNRGALRNLLLRHITMGDVSTDQLTANGAEMLDGSNRLFPSSQFTLKDIEATNGVVDGVNVVFSGPTVNPNGESILDVLANDARFSGLVAALSISNLSDTLDAGGTYTFFAPTNDAFIKLGVTRVRQLYNNLDLLNSVLSHHIIQGSALSESDFGDQNGKKVQTLAGDQVTLANIGGDLLINGVLVRIDSIAASNGIIYIIDTVLDDQ